MTDTYNIPVQANQCLLDIAIQEYGSAEGLVLLMRDNNLSADATLAAGTSLVVRNTPINKGVKNYLASRGVKVGTHFGGLVAGSIYGPNGIRTVGEEIVLQARPYGGDKENYGITWFVDGIESGYGLTLIHTVIGFASIYYVVDDGDSQATSPTLKIKIKINSDITIGYGAGQTAEADADGYFTLPPSLPGGGFGNVNFELFVDFDAQLQPNKTIDITFTTNNPVWGVYATLALQDDGENTIYYWDGIFENEVNHFTIKPTGTWNRIGIYIMYINNFSETLTGRIQWELEE